MRIRKRYFPCYGRAEKNLDFFLNWMEQPFFVKVFKKAFRNLKISVIRYLGKDCLIDSYGMQLKKLNFKRTLPVSLSKKDLIEALLREYNFERTLPVSLSKDLEKSLSKSEKEKLIQEHKAELKREASHFLEAVEFLKTLKV